MPVGSPGAMVVLVDHHVLDSYLAIAALRPRRALLVHGPACSAEARRLAAACAVRLRVPCEPLPLTDDGDLTQVQALARRLPADAHLHYTGGTGIVAAVLRSEHAAAGRPDADASHLDEARRVLRFDDGRELTLEELVDPADFDLDALLAISGFARAGDSSRARARQARFSDLIDGALARYTPPRHAEAGAMLHDLATRLRDRVSGDPDGAVRDWPNGRFFEDLVRHFALRVAPKLEVHAGVIVLRDELKAELDVVAIGRYRPYIVSCAVGGRPDTVKMKMFEVLHRARQVGGQTARAAVACTLPDAAQITPRELESLARETPVAADAPVVFGAADVAGWLRGEERALARLDAFLSS